MNIHSVYRIFQRYFRPKRIRALRAMLPVLDDPQARILDVGGSPNWWADVKPRARSITIVNTDARMADACKSAGFEFRVVDGRALPFADQSFSLVMSNSVIEHVGDLADQQRFATELQRCGKALYMQTPNRWFPVEPHLIALCIHWFPFGVQRRLVRWLSVWAG